MRHCFGDQWHAQFKVKTSGRRTWMEVGAQSMKRTACRSLIAARLLCTCPGSTSPCSHRRES
jgi:ornithine cyclodeaminase/alanine dehydrogenase-like protein (mu-crystallin family)